MNGPEHDRGGHGDAPRGAYLADEVRALAEAAHGFPGGVVEAVEGPDELGVMEDHELVKVMLLKGFAHRLAGFDVLFKLVWSAHGSLPEWIGRG